MPSGKKARGRKNRAKKEATRNADLRTLWEPTLLCDNSGVKNTTTSPCEHVLVALPPIPRDGPVVSFMNCLASEGLFNGATDFTGNPIDLCLQPLSRFPEVAEEESERSLAIDLLLRFIRNTFVHDALVEGEKWFHYRALNEVMICIMIKVLELVETYSIPIDVRRRVAKIGNRLGGSNNCRDVVKFVSKRLPCSCLKKLHRAARKKVVKMGQCFGCDKTFPRSQLYVCTGCNHNVYCSRECQRGDWSRHKEVDGCGIPRGK